MYEYVVLWICLKVSHVINKQCVDDGAFLCTRERTLFHRLPGNSSARGCAWNLPILHPALGLCHRWQLELWNDNLPEIMKTTPFTFSQGRRYSERNSISLSQCVWSPWTSFNDKRKSWHMIYSVHCTSSPQLWYFVKQFWHVPPDVGLLLLLLCSQPNW